MTTWPCLIRPEPGPDFKSKSWNHAVINKRKYESQIRFYVNEWICFFLYLINVKKPFNLIKTNFIEISIVPVCIFLSFKGEIMDCESVISFDFGNFSLNKHAVFENGFGSGLIKQGPSRSATANLLEDCLNGQWHSIYFLVEFSGVNIMNYVRMEWTDIAFTFSSLLAIKFLAPAQCL